MKENAYNPARTNQQSPQPGMASVDTNNFDELEEKTGATRDNMPAEPKEFDTEKKEHTLQAEEE